MLIDQVNKHLLKSKDKDIVSQYFYYKKGKHSYKNILTGNSVDKIDKFYPLNNKSEVKDV